MLNGCHGVEETLPLGAYKQRQDIVEARRVGGQGGREGKLHELQEAGEHSRQWDPWEVSTGSAPGCHAKLRGKCERTWGFERLTGGRGRKGTVCFHVQ